MDHRIGELTMNGKPAFYAYVDGYEAEPTIGTLNEIEIALGLRVAIKVATATTKIKIPLRSYSVTITPKAISWAGGVVFGEYDVSVDAVTAAAAIAQARRARVDEEGRLGVPATYRAALAA